MNPGPVATATVTDMPARPTGRTSVSPSDRLPQRPRLPASLALATLSDLGLRWIDGSLRDVVVAECRADLPYSGSPKPEDFRRAHVHGEMYRR